MRDMMAVTPPAYSHDAEKDSKTTPASLTNEDHLGQQNVFGDETHRRLKGRHIQLIGIGGTIGTVLFVCSLASLFNACPA
jgi:amino acid permease